MTRDIRGRGPFIGLEPVCDRQSKEPFNPPLKSHTKLYSDAMARGLMVYLMGGGLLTVRAARIACSLPPFMLDKAVAGTIVERL